MEAAAAAEAMPGYAELVRRGYGSLAGAVRGCGECGWELSRRTWAENARLAWSEPLLCLLGAVAWTLARRAASRRLFRPFAEWCQLDPKDAAKVPESIWKLLYYLFSWSYSSYLLFFAGYPFFYDPPSVFYDWRKGMEVPTDIAVAYLMQCSFYCHSIYASLYMDTWRKDSVVMLIHHVVTLVLIALSYVFRYHNVGILVLFLHDITDVQLEFTKLNVYFKYRGGVYHPLNDFISNIGCISFSISWFWFRLYWFPLKVLYATCHSSLRSVPNIPFYFFFNALLFILTLMNLYWFTYIVLFVAKVLMGQVQEVNDVREYDADSGRKVAALQKDNGKLHNAGSCKERYLSARRRSDAWAVSLLDLQAWQSCPPLLLWKLPGLTLVWLRKVLSGREKASSCYGNHANHYYFLEATLTALQQESIGSLCHFYSVILSNSSACINKLNFFAR